MNIGFDLDKVFIDYPPLIPDSLIDRLYKKKSNGILAYRFPSKPEQYLRKASHLPFLRPVIKENVKFLRNIPRDHKLYLISSRFGFLKSESEDLVKRNKFDKVFEKICFNFSNEEPHIFKDQKIHDLKLDIYLDDDFPLLKYVAKKNKKTRFFWLNKNPKKSSLTRNITAVNSISDIFS